MITWPSRTSIPYEGLGKGRPLLDDRGGHRADQAALAHGGSDLRRVSGHLKLQLGRKKLAVDVSGVHPSFGAMRNVIPAAGGRFINPLDMERKRRVAFLGDELAENLFGSS